MGRGERCNVEDGVGCGTHGRESVLLSRCSATCSVLRWVCQVLRPLRCHASLTVAVVASRGWAALSARPLGCECRVTSCCLPRTRAVDEDVFDLMLTRQSAA